MDEDIKKILIDKFAAMPADIQEMVLSDEFRQSLSQLVKKEGLSEVQDAQLEGEVTMVIFGITNIEEFPHVLAKELSISSGKANGIAAEIDANIFAKVRTSLNRVQGLGPDEEPSENRSSDPALRINNQQASPAQQTPAQPAPTAPEGKRGPGAQPDPYREPIEE